MEQKDKVYFGENGLTNASANHVCKLCAEKVQQLNSRVNAVRLLNEYIEIPATGTKTLVRGGFSEQDLNEIPALLDEIGDYYALEAWLREGIKAKEAAMKDAELNFSVWKEVTGNEEEEKPVFFCKLKSPVAPKDVTADDVIALWTVKERNRVFELHTRAAVYGKYIGISKGNMGTESGAYCKARKEYFDRHVNTVDVKGSGQDTTLTKYEESVVQTEEEKVFFLMEQKHRALNAELNGIQHRIEVEGLKMAREREAEYQKALAEYQTLYSREREKYNAELEAWNAKHEQLVAEWTEWKRQKAEEVQALKIIIPNNLVETYKKVTGKE